MAEPDDFLTHYAGTGTGRGIAKNKDKYDKLTNIIMMKFSGDREIEPSSVTCMHDITGLASASCEVYDGVTRYKMSAGLESLHYERSPRRLKEGWFDAT